MAGVMMVRKNRNRKLIAFIIRHFKDSKEFTPENVMAKQEELNQRVESKNKVLCLLISYPSLFRRFRTETERRYTEEGHLIKDIFHYFAIISDSADIVKYQNGYNGNGNKGGER
jgi:hypothetical protein